jgi:hypothetical protein
VKGFGSFPEVLGAGVFVGRMTVEGAGPAGAGESLFISSIVPNQSLPLKSE